MGYTSQLSDAGKIIDTLDADNKALRAEVERYKEALEEIRDAPFFQSSATTLKECKDIAKAALDQCDTKGSDDAS